MAREFGNSEVGSVAQACPLRKEVTPVEQHWITIELVGEDDQPIPWEEYKIVLPNGEVAQGFLNEKGLAKVEAIPTAGQCKVSFPKLDKSLWDPA